MSKTTETLIKVGAVGFGAYYVLGQASKAGGIGKWLNSLAGGAGAANSALGTTTSQVVGTTGGPAVITNPPTVDLSSAVGIFHAAQAAGVTSATSAAAYQYGRALWAVEHGGNSSGYDALNGNDQVVWNSVAINGH